MISNRKATFNILECLEPGQEFSGYRLMLAVRKQTGKTLYPATALRYLRIFRQETGRRIINVDKMRSIYKVL